MKKKYSYRILMAVSAFILLSCNLVNSIRDVASSPPGESILLSEEVWPDIPIMTNMEQVDLPLPDAASIGVKIGFGSTGFDLSSTRISYLAFTTDQSIERVTTFYTSAIMEQYGWMMLNADKCGKSKKSAFQVLGGNCGFVRLDSSGIGTMLLIFLQMTPENSPSEVFFVRIENFDLSREDA